MYESTNYGAGIILIIIMVLIYAAALGILLLNYILSASAMYKLSNRRGIPYPWMAWIPVLNNWNMGLVANEYDEQLGMKRKWHLVMIFAYCAFIALYVIVFIAMIVFMVFTAIQGDSLQIGTIIVPFIILYVLMIVIMIGAVLINFLHYILLFKVFESTVPEKAVLYIILSLIIPLASAICLMKCADKGYPFPVTEPICTESETAE